MAFDAGSVIVKIQADLKGFQQGLDKAQKSTEKFRNSASVAMESVSEFGKKAKVATAVATAALGVTTKKALDMASQFEQSEIAFTTLLKDRKKAIEAIKEIEKDAKSTPYNLPDLIKANQLLISAGVNTNDAREQIKSLGNAVAATGGGTSELNRLAQNMQQIKAVGKASAVDIKQFAFAGINIYSLLAETTGKTVEEVKEMDISYELLTQSLSDASKEGGMFAGAMENQSKSLQGIISNIEDVVSIGLKDIMVNSGLFDALKSGAESFLGFIEGKIPDITKAFTIMGNIISYIIEIFKGEDLTIELEEALSYFTGGDGERAAAVIETIINVFRGLSTWISENKELVITFLKGLAFGFGALMIVGVIAGLFAMLTNPITIFIGIIALLYTAWQTNFMGIQEIVANIVPFVVGAFMFMKGIIKLVMYVIQTSISTAMAIISGDWSAAWEFMKSYLLYVINIIKQVFIGLYNLISTVLTFVVQLLQSWSTSIGSIFANIASGVYQFISNFVSAISSGFSNVLTTVSGKMSEVSSSISDKLTQAYNSASDIVTNIKNSISESFQGLLTSITNAMNSIYDAITGSFTRAYDRAVEIADSIRSTIASAFDVDERNSPSIRDRLNDVKNLTEMTLSGIEIPQFSGDIASRFATSAIQPVNNDTSTNVTQNIQATLSNDIDIDVLSERLQFLYKQKAL